MRTILFSFAHPDDESFSGAGTAMKYAAQGARIVVGRPGAPENPEKNLPALGGLRQEVTGDRAFDHAVKRVGGGEGSPEH